MKLFRQILTAGASIALASCGIGPKEHHASDFGSPRLPKAGQSLFYVGEDTAREIAGAFLHAATRGARFSSDTGGTSILGRFKASEIERSNLDTTFEFGNYLPGWIHSPAQIDVRFPSGKGLRFCFSGIVYDLSKVPSGGCPEQP